MNLFEHDIIIIDSEREIFNRYESNYLRNMSDSGQSFNTIVMSPATYNKICGTLSKADKSVLHVDLFCPPDKIYGFTR